MKRLYVIAIVVGLLLGLAVTFVDVGAQSPVPDGVQVFYIDDWRTCVLWPDGSGDCYCPCEAGACETASYEATETPHEATPTKEATATLEPTATPEPTDESGKCNRGGGNGSEGCDPGNSGGNPGNAGEGHDG